MRPRYDRCYPGDAGAFAAGAFDSLSAVELSSALGGQLGLQLPGTLAFDYPSVAAMAAHLHSLLAPEHDGEASSHMPVAAPADNLKLTHPAAQHDIVRVSWRPH